jgi:hypothetical protein
MPIEKIYHRTDRTEQQARDERLERIIRALERLERRFDEFAGTYLNARFPFGKATDRWARRG